MEEVQIDPVVETINFKVLVVGNPSVGKTSLVRRISDGTFSTHYKTTIGVDFSTKTIKWSENLHLNIDFWDLAGQDKLNNQGTAYYRGAAGVLCVCDIMVKETQTQLDDWRTVIATRSTNPRTGEGYDPPCVMIMNKMDLLTADDLMDLNFDPNLVQLDILHDCEGKSLETYAQSQLIEEISRNAKSKGYVAGVAVSVKDNIGIDTALKVLIEKMIAHYRSDENYISQTISLGKPSKTTRKGCSC